MPVFPQGGYQLQSNESGATDDDEFHIDTLSDAEAIQCCLPIMACELLSLHRRQKRCAFVLHQEHQEPGRRGVARVATEWPLLQAIDRTRRCIVTMAALPPDSAWVY